MTVANIHQQQPLISKGTNLDEATVAVIMIHGRGAGPQGILPLANHFEADGVAYLAPSAEGNTWYPNRFIAPRQSNEPHLSSALETIQDLLDLVRETGIPPEKTVILGFSQGACLATEFVARNPQRYGAVVAFSGGLIGTDGELEGYEGSLEGTPVFLGCSDVDFHIPIERVHETRDILSGLGAQVDERIYQGMGHMVNTDEVGAVNTLLKTLL